jgi:hypothetical protein
MHNAMAGVKAGREMADVEQWHDKRTLPATEKSASALRPPAVQEMGSFFQKMVRNGLTALPWPVILIYLFPRCDRFFLKNADCFFTSGIH